jgi:septal ring factor EnvC (AmiA/AmiB activator)
VTSITETQPRERNGNGWKTTALGAVWGLLILVAGWIATDATTARTKMADDLASDRQRIAVLEERDRNVRESLVRIEHGVDDLREQLRQAQERRR